MLVGILRHQMGPIVCWFIPDAILDTGLGVLSDNLFDLISWSMLSAGTTKWSHETRSLPLFIILTPFNVDRRDRQSEAKLSTIPHGVECKKNFLLCFHCVGIVDTERNEFIKV